MGLIGSGPTILGTVIGRQFTSAAVSVIFLALAVGSILYVVIQLLGVAYKSGRKDLLTGESSRAGSGVPHRSWS